jgi:hypothetical protein
MKERGGVHVTFYESERASCDSDFILPWHLDLAQSLGCTITGIECTIMVVVVPCKVAIDEASNRDGT